MAAVQSCVPCLHHDCHSLGRNGQQRPAQHAVQQQSSGSLDGVSGSYARYVAALCRRKEGNLAWAEEALEKQLPASCVPPVAERALHKHNKVQHASQQGASRAASALS